jgi:UDP-2-acetamido-3-amino-2,3-dideoxy-glucuronate N-acetyltransferase
VNNISICVIGAGRWGINHIKTLLKLGVLGGVVDIDIKKIKSIKERYPKVIFFDNLEEAFKENFDGFVVATPPSTHFEITKSVLYKNKPVLVEKPLTLSLKEAKKIKTICDRLSGTLMVGHLLLFHPAIERMKALIEENIIGDIQYIYSNRINLGIVRKEENVFWSFAPHDISLFQYFNDSFPIQVSSDGGAFLQKNIHDTTITYLKYPNGVHGHIYVSWLHPFKEHRIVIMGSKGSLYFENFPEQKLLLYEKKINSKSDKIFLTNKPPKSIEFDQTKPLTNELKYFIEVINGKQVQKSKINEGLDVVKILELASKSLENNNATSIL